MGRQVRHLEKGHDVRDVAFSRDGRLLAAAENRWQQVVVWEVATGQEVRRFRSEERFFSVAFSPDGRLVAAGNGDNNGVVHVWELASGGEVRTFAGQLGGGLSLAWAPDGCMLASGGNGTIVLWDVSGQALGRVRLPRTEKELESCWVDLGAANAGRAIDAVYALRGAPAEAVRFLRDAFSLRGPWLRNERPAWWPTWTVRVSAPASERRPNCAAPAMAWRRLCENTWPRPARPKSGVVCSR